MTAFRIARGTSALASIFFLGAFAPSASAAGCDGATGLSCINELLIEMPGKDTSREYVELRGPAGSVIPVGTYFVSVDGDKNQNPGRIDTVVNLGGLAFGASDGNSPYGFLVLLPFNSQYGPQVNATATLVQSTATGFTGLPSSRWSGLTANYVRPTTSYFLVQAAAAPVIGTDIDTNNDGVAESVPETIWNVLDSVGAADNPQDRTYARINFRRLGASSIGTTVTIGTGPGYFGRFGDSFGSTPSAWILSAPPGGSYPNWTLGTSVPTGVNGKPLNHIGGLNAWANAAPVNTLPATQSVLEDQVLALAGAAHITVADADGGLILPEQVTLAASNGTVSLASTTGLTVTGNGTATIVATGPLAALNAALDTLSFTASPNFNGTAGITVTTNDQGSTGTDGAKSDTDLLAITVGAVNDAPSFAVAANATVLEDAGAQSFAGFASAISAGPANESGQQLAFTVTGNSNPALFAAGPAVDVGGTLTFTPTANLSGSATITLALVDDGGIANGGVDTATRTFDIVVQNINDAPSFTAGAGQTVLEDAGAQAIAGWATNINDNDLGVTQAVSFVVSGNTTPGLFSVGPAIDAAGTLTYTPAADANGSATITLVAVDDGGTLNGGSDTSAAQQFTIAITAVNDAPDFATGATQTAAANAGPQVANPWATSISAGPADEAGQTVTFQVVGNDNPGIFSAAPQVSAAGILSWTPSAATPGSANIQLLVVDDGGTANGGIDTSTTRTFVITTTPDVTPPALGAEIDDGDADNFVLVNETLTYTIEFSEPINAASLTAADFGNAGTASLTFANASATGASATVEVTPTSLGTIVLRIAGAVTDPTGNPLSVPVDDNTTVRARTNTSTLITNDQLDPSIPGELYAVTVTVGAPFGAPTGTVNIVDDLGATCSATLAAGTATCSLVSALGNRTLTATYVPDDVSYITSSDSDSHQVFRPADLVTTKNDGDNYVNVGDPLLYTIVVANVGPEALTGVQVQDLLPPELSGAIWSCTAGSCPTPSTGTGDINVTVDLALGASVTFSLAADVAAGAQPGFVVNQATATLPAGYRDNSPANNAAQDRDELYGIFKDGFE